jgi:hypothetical protein
VLDLEAAKVAVVKRVDAVIAIARMANIENALVFVFIVWLH